MRKFKNFSNAPQKNVLTLSQYGEDQFVVTGPFMVFTDEVKKIIKENGALWNGSVDVKGWVLNNQVYDKVRVELSNANGGIELNLIPWFCNALKRGIGDELTFFATGRDKHVIHYGISDQMRDIRKDLNKKLFERLYPYQRQCVERGITLLGRILIADEMGVGKTVQSLALASIYKDCWPLLIICPSTLRLNWQDEVTNWMEIDSKLIQIINNSKQDISAKAQVVIISYDLCHKLEDKLIARKFKIAIGDEAHYLKTCNSQRSQSCVPLLKSCKHVILLTGTPALAKPRELFNLVSIIRPDIFTNFRDFGMRYCDPKPSRFVQGLDYDGSSNLSELHYNLKTYLMIRRLKSEVLSQLPQKRRQRFRIQTDPKLSKVILSMIGTATAQLEREEFTNDNTLMSCYKLTSKAKTKFVLEYLEELLKNDSKIIFFAHHIEMLDEVEKFVKSEQIRSIRIDGSVDHEVRHQNVKLFQENPDVKIAILSLTAASVGLTLTASSTIVFGEMHWTPAIMLQAEDRAHRIGQTEKVDCIYLVGEDTLDDLLFKKIEKKFSTVSSMIDGKNQCYDAHEGQSMPSKNKDSKKLLTQAETEKPQPQIQMDDNEDELDTNQLFELIDQIQSSKKSHSDNQPITENQQIQEEKEIPERPVINDNDEDIFKEVEKYSAQKQNVVKSFEDSARQIALLESIEKKCSEIKKVPDLDENGSPHIKINKKSQKMKTTYLEDLTTADKMFMKKCLK